MTQTFDVATEAAMMKLAAEIGLQWSTGTVVYLHGELGAGKTTFVRGLMAGLGWTDPVRSPTFNLLQVFDTSPPVLHADLYRLTSAEGTGIEDYLESHLCLIEWPDRMGTMVRDDSIWHVHIEILPNGRRLIIRPAR